MEVFWNDWREAAALSLSKGMRRGQNSPMDKSLKRPGRLPARKAYSSERRLGTKERLHAPQNVNNILLSLITLGGIYITPCPTKSE
jgi:hypothetical protein